MWRWIRQLAAGFRQGGGPGAGVPDLAGRPPVRRRKTYSGDSGYVYEYYYEGYRVAARGGSAGAEYLFTVSSDRRSWFAVSVFLEDSAVAAWEQAHGRELNMTERYAVVKMALFEAFDQRDHPSRMRRGVTIRRESIGPLLEALGID